VQALHESDPQAIGEYALVGRLGRGAMGTVYLGKSPGGRPVAVKVARPELAGDPEFRERFRREVEIARTVGGFWTAAVVDAGPDAARPWLATEYVAGPTLQQAVEIHGPLPESAVRRLAAGLAEALAAIHKAGLVHRDLKPSNVILGGDGPRVIDFGISRAVRHPGLTEVGVVFGTPGFLSPEQVLGGEVGPPTDVFSLGAVLVYAATGRGPFGEGDTSSLVYRAVHAEPDMDKVPPSLRTLIMTCLQRDPAARPDPAQLLSWAGSADIATPTSVDWLPAPVQTLVDERRTELVGQRNGARPAAPRPPTKQFTEPPGKPRQPAATPHATFETAPDGTRFQTSRFTALIMGSLSVVGASIMAGVADAGSQAGPFGRFLAGIGFILLAIFAVRLLFAALRPQLTLHINREGLVLSQQNQHRQLAWRDVVRVRVVDHKSRPWLVVWLKEKAVPPKSLGQGTFRSYHGGVRVFPVGHDRLRQWRVRDVRELRAALAWYAPRAYDPNP
jgi:serine/threonine protein kinase